MFLRVCLCPFEISAEIPGHRLSEGVHHGDDPFFVRGRHHAASLLFADLSWFFFASSHNDFQSKRLSEYVWEEQGQILALLSIGDTADIDKKGAFEIWRIYVRPEAQGHNIGSKCILFAEQEAKRQGYQEIVIWAFQENTTAISFYQKNGYVIDKNEYLGEPYLTFGIRLIKTLM